ncbi:transcriptional repressor [Erysipelothrix sp. HDW6A]|uniref:Fur family transcriptional regulator n=1 Tax=Erysipelothrix sp. HDW6A TaxID=2714928 RepID=UPI001408BB48|nr:transcriptional repressor [Erysipelothrix sp. HDW6A]QIK56616.1 transcriptional repressor [Erysipelothrix sp. HDW6A]
MEVRYELEKKGIKVTKQRVAILKVLLESTVPLTINQIQDLVDLPMDLSTLYRTLDTFYEKSLILKTVPLEPSQTVYEFNHLVHKHHLICTNCGKILVIQGCPLHEYEDEVESSTGFIIDRHQLELYGLCASCQKQLNVTKKEKHTHV